MKQWIGWMAAVVMFCANVEARAQQSAPPLSLEEAEQRALAGHPQIRAVEYSAQAADEAVKEARSAYFPTVAASLTATQAETGSRIAAGGLNNPIILDRFASGVAFGQLVTDFGRTSAFAQSSSLRAASVRETVVSRRADVLLQVDKAYFETLRGQAVEKVAQETVNARQLVVDQVTALAASGLKSALDVSFARVNLSEAQLLLVQARNELEAAFTTLSAAMGSSEATRYELVEQPLPSEPATDGAPFVVEALENRPDVAAQRLAQRAAASFTAAEGAARLPSISVIGALGATPYREIGLSSRYAAVGVNLTVPITTGGLLAARRAEAGLKASSEQQRLQDLQNSVSRDVRIALLDIHAAFRRLELAQQLESHAADAADLAQARYENGLGSIVELTQAQLNKTRADIEAATARYDCQVRAAVLKFQTGAFK
jgi:outer membrane protein